LEGGLSLIKRFVQYDARSLDAFSLGHSCVVGGAEEVVVPHALSDSTIGGIRGLVVGLKECHQDNLVGCLEFF